MRILDPGSSEKHGRPISNTIYCSPNADGAQRNEWDNPDGTPRMIEVHFANGEAEVPDELGNYLVDKGLAKRPGLLS